MALADIECSFDDLSLDDLKSENVVGQFQIIQNFLLPQPCRAFAFSWDNETVVIGQGCDILVFQNQNNTYLKQNELKGHQSCISHIVYSQFQDLFLSAGSWNDKLILWQKQDNQNWHTQELSYQDNQTEEFEIRKLFFNAEENECIAALDYNFLIVWQQSDDNTWNKIQQIQVVQKGYYKIEDAQYNKSNDKLICFTQNKSILIYIQNQNKKWKKYQCINIHCQNSILYYQWNLDEFYVFRNGGDGIILKLNEMNELYEESQDIVESNIFEIISQKNSKTGKLYENHLQKFLACQNQRELLIQLQNYEQNYELSQKIEFEKSFYFQFSNDGNYLITWDYTQQIVIRRQQE